MIRPEIVKNISIIVREQVPDARIILYGSEARGDSHPNSDIDVLILLNQDFVS